MTNTLPIAEVFLKRRSASSGAKLFGGEKRHHLNLEGLGQDDEFTVRNATQLRFDFRKRSPAQIQSQYRTPSSKQFLRQPLLVSKLSHLRSDNIFLFSHAPEMELDTKSVAGLNCSNFGATCFDVARNQSRFRVSGTFSKVGTSTNNERAGSQ